MKFSINIEAHFVLDETDVWTDNDGPDEPTAADVMRQMKREGSVLRLIDQWHLGPELDVSVAGSGHQAPMVWWSTFKETV